MTTTPLLDAVDALTIGRIEHVTQTADDGTFIRSVPVDIPAPILWLERAITPSTNSDGGSASPAHTRSIINSGALYEFTMMTNGIRDWCQIVAAPISTDGTWGERAIHNLRQWYIAYQRTDMLADDFYLGQLRRWLWSILDRQDPPKSLEVTLPCPVCGDAWVNADGDTVKHPLELTYRKDNEGIVTREKVTCRNRGCSATWTGIDAISELGLELGEKDELQTTA
ncbi:hypothetical protein [Rathayibacter sp. AY2B9]|uniref:hypothetical protein n=1 Tax=Rathayibacter sp. AY2B9 TaxID=2080572 RepID=UPI000CE796B2|nr:hypothetical protein [Rathayibacter sp. AY2B9]PPG34514.1 hypothetical protein C5C25_00390 [Rathayibacter sp. AY2B9]